MSEIYTPDGLARLFHETYERLAPEYGYETREASAVPWADVPAANKGLMRAVAAHVLGRFTAETAPPAELTEAQRAAVAEALAEQDEQAEGVQAAPTQTPAGRCSHCQHPINDHSHRRDQKVYADQRRPWCHACNARCDYEQAEGGL